MKILLIAFLLLLILVGAVAYYLTPTKENKAEPTIQYSKPIGPTKQPPYILPSRSILNG